MTGQDSHDGFQMSSADFSRLAAFINGYSGIRMPPSKRVMVEGRLRKRLRSHGFGDFESYCRYLFENGGLADEASHIIDAVTTNKTEFFREQEHFHFLVNQALPNLVGGRSVPTLKLWSAACSIGAEPYTLAMIMADYARARGGVRYSILATDLCMEVLQKAVHAIYPEEAIGPVPLEMRRRYLLRGRGHAVRQVRIAPEIRRTVRFARLNLMDDPYPVDGLYDVIFCRNVLIYFDRADQEAVLRRLAGHLVRGGYLFLGHSETITNMLLPLQPAGPTVFTKI